MDNPDITMEEYIQLEAKKACRRGQEFNWKTATYDKVRYFVDIDYFKDFKTDFPAIVYKHALKSKPRVSSELTFGISSWRGSRVDGRSYLLSGAIAGSEANRIIRDSKLEFENSQSVKEEKMYVKFSNNVEAEKRGSYLDVEGIKWEKVIACTLRQLKVLMKDCMANMMLYRGVGRRSEAKNEFKLDLQQSDLVPSIILDLYFKRPEDVVNRILQVVLDLQHFKSSPCIFAEQRSSESLLLSAPLTMLYIKS
ncbi:hypothetical protein Tco_0663196 [Tanacetum coccineum]